MNRRKFLKAMAILAAVGTVDIKSLLSCFERKEIIYSFPSAISTFSLEDFDKLLKEMYLPVIQDYLNSDYLNRDLIRLP